VREPFAAPDSNNQWTKSVAAQGKTSNSGPTSPGYQASGVNTDLAEDGLGRLIGHIKSTWSLGDARVQLDLGYFANVIDLAGVGIAICTDGIGSKALVAQMVGKYDTVGIDCVAMNVNDLICVGATPLTMVDYVAVESAQPAMLEAIGAGLAEGARQSNISISGGEIAQLKDIIKGVGDGLGFDLAGTAIGRVDLDRINLGAAVGAGDVIIGIASNGIHSNGLSLARRALFDLAGYRADSHVDALGGSVGEELLRPTYIYVAEALDILDQVADVGALIHITGDGFLNLTRVKAEVGFVIDALPEAPALFPLIQDITGSDNREMFHVFNMGIGFCLVVRPEAEDQVLNIVRGHGKACQRIGYVTEGPVGSVRIESAGIEMIR
jgi:phosphoribosylformylglycinamidine cyclo-ligase